MIKTLNKNFANENILYNNMLLLARKQLFYTKFNLSDTFQNRINLIFLHISFLFNKIKKEKEKNIYKDFYQNSFDLTFKNIELNMRELGYGDVAINKNMKLLVKTFYNILLYCENFKNETEASKNIFFSKFLSLKSDIKNVENMPLINYFGAYQAFCFDLSSDSVLKGEIKFKYN